MLKHNNKSQALRTHPAFRALSNFKKLVVGCGVDVDRGSIYFACYDKDQVPPVPISAVGFEGIQFEGGLQLAVSRLVCSLDVRLGESELLKALQAKATPELDGFEPLEARLQQLSMLRVGAGGMAPAVSGAPCSGRQWLVPSSGHDHLLLAADASISCNAFLCSLMAAELRCTRGGFYYEVELCALGGTGMSTRFDIGARDYDHTKDEDDEDADNAQPHGGLAAFGWGTPSRFHGIYHENRGVGHHANSWGYAGAMLKTETSAGPTKAGVSKEPKQTQYVSFSSASPRLTEERWDQPDQPEPLWRQGGIVGCGVVVQPDGSGTIEYFYDGQSVKTVEVRAPLLRGGVVPAISLHANMVVRVNMGERDFLGRNEHGKPVTRKEPPDNRFQAALRSADASEEASTSTRRRPLTGKNAAEKAKEKKLAVDALPTTIADMVEDEKQFGKVLGPRGMYPRVGESLVDMANDIKALADGRPLEEGQVAGGFAPPVSLRDGALIDAMFDVLEAFPDGVQHLRCSECQICPVMIVPLASRLEAQERLCTLDLSKNSLVSGAQIPNSPWPQCLPQIAESHLPGCYTTHLLWCAAVCALTTVCRGHHDARSGAPLDERRRTVHARCLAQ
jgi:hypothetical protein